MIHRIEKCFGIPIWKLGKTYVELWICFGGVAPHVHPGQASEIIPLLGWSDFVRVRPDGIKDSVRITPMKWLRAFTVPADWVHYFTTRFLVFLNVSDRCAGTNLKYV